MKTHRVAIGTLVWLCLVTGMGCGGDDDTSPTADAGPDSGELGGSGGRSGNGGSGGKSGSGATAAGSGGEGGEGGSGNQEGKYQVSGELSGLSGSGLKLMLNGGSDLSPTKNGTFMFDADLSDGDDYEVTVDTQPKDPAQNCTVSDGKGKIDKADVTNVKVSCASAEPRSVGGTLTGVDGGTVVLKNGDESLSLNADGKFTFKNKVSSGASYSVSVQTNPSGKTCSVDHASGTIGDNDVTDVAVACYGDLTLVAMPRPGSIGLSWNNNGAMSYSALVTTASNCNFDDVASCENGAQQANVTSPYVFGGLTDGKVYYFQIRASYAGGLQTHSATVGVRPNRPQFDKAVNTVALGGSGVVYVGGAFSYIGAFTGSTIPLDATTGAPTRIPNFPTMTGGVAAVVSDGSGGFFFGGSFGSVGDTERNGLAHIKQDGSLDMTWDPNVTGEVTSLALSGQTLYLGGSFTAVGGTARKNLAAVSTTGAGAVTPWDRQPDQPVYALAIGNNTLYVGGDFTMVSADARGYLAAFDIATTPGTPTIKTDWNPNATGPNGVRALLATNDTLYASGYFQMIGSDARNGLAAIDASGAAKPFQPDPDGLVLGMALVDDKLYVGGNFSQVGGKTRKNLAVVATADGAAQDGWTPEPDGAVNALAISGDTVYVGGDFTAIGSGATPRLHMAALDRGNASVKPWNPAPSAGVSVVALSGDTIYVSGDDVRTMAAEPRARLASFNGSSLTTWAPSISGGDVFALAYSGTTVYAGGEFDSVGSATRQGIAAIDGTGAATSWDAHLATGGLVYALAVDDNRVYIGGQFGPTATHSNLIGLSKTDSGMVWGSPSPDSVVRALVLSDGTLYVGGEFANVGSGRAKLAAIDSSGGLVAGWNPGANDTVNALAVDGDNVYIGGAFTQLGGSARNHLGAVAKTDAALNAWDPNLDGEVTGLALSSHFLYAGGQFSQVGTGGSAESRSGTAQFDVSSAFAVTPWARNVVGDVFGINVNGDNSRIYIVGDFFSVANQPATDFFAASSADTE
jgi:hypothetical protein